MVLGPVAVTADVGFSKCQVSQDLLAGHFLVLENGWKVEGILTRQLALCITAHGKGTVRRTGKRTDENRNASYGGEGQGVLRTNCLSLNPHSLCGPQNLSLGGPPSLFSFEGY